ncbi:hypothetical protein HMI54_004358, partial [Coelomomyces lativittatus]
MLPSSSPLSSLSSMTSHSLCTSPSIPSTSSTTSSSSFLSMQDTLQWWDTMSVETLSTDQTLQLLDHVNALTHVSFYELQQCEEDIPTLLPHFFQKSTSCSSSTTTLVSEDFMETQIKDNDHEVEERLKSSLHQDSFMNEKEKAPPFFSSSFPPASASLRFKLTTGLLLRKLQTVETALKDLDQLEDAFLQRGGYPSLPPPSTLVPVSTRARLFSRTRPREWYARSEEDVHRWVQQLAVLPPTYETRLHRLVCDIPNLIMDVSDRHARARTLSQWYAQEDVKSILEEEWGCIPVPWVASIQDPWTYFFEKRCGLMATWTLEEEHRFRLGYARFGKEFLKIAQFMHHSKSVGQVVAFYYLHKHRLQLKKKKKKKKHPHSFLGESLLLPPPPLPSSLSPHELLLSNSQPHPLLPSTSLPPPPPPSDPKTSTWSSSSSSSTDPSWMVKWHARWRPKETELLKQGILQDGKAIAKRLAQRIQTKTIEQCKNWLHNHKSLVQQWLNEGQPPPLPSTHAPKKTSFTTGSASSTLSQPSGTAPGGGGGGGAKRKHQEALGGSHASKTGAPRKRTRQQTTVHPSTSKWINEHTTGDRSVGSQETCLPPPPLSSSMAEPDVLLKPKPHLPSVLAAQGTRTKATSGSSTSMGFTSNEKKEERGVAPLLPKSVPSSPSTAPSSTFSTSVATTHNDAGYPSTLPSLPFSSNTTFLPKKEDALDTPPAFKMDSDLAPSYPLDPPRVSLSTGVSSNLQTTTTSSLAPILTLDPNPSTPLPPALLPSFSVLPSSSTYASSPTGPPPLPPREPSLTSNLVQGTVKEEPKKSNYWKQVERQMFQRLVEQYGKDFEAISKKLESKSIEQIEQYYYKRYANSTTTSSSTSTTTTKLKPSRKPPSSVSSSSTLIDTRTDVASPSSSSSSSSSTLSPSLSQPPSTAMTKSTVHHKHGRHIPLHTLLVSSPSSSSSSSSSTSTSTSSSSPTLSLPFPTPFAYHPMYPTYPPPISTSSSPSHPLPPPPPPIPHDYPPPYSKASISHLMV